VARAAMLAMLVVCALPGGMASVTATQVAQYAVLLVGTLAVLLLSAGASQGVPVVAAHGAAAASETVGLSPAAGIALPAAELLDNAELMLCLMTGTASLPHMLIHPMTTRGMRQARASATWSLLFIIVLAVVLPAEATLAADNAGLFSGLLAVVFLSGMLAGTSALLLTLATSLDHDLWRRLPAWRPPTGAVGRPRMDGLRPLMVIAAVLAAYAAQKQALEPRIMLACAFSLAAAGFFPALVLGIWWRRASTAGAAAGMVAGFALCVLYLVVSRYFPQAGMQLFGMTALVDPVSGRAVVDAERVLADPEWLADVPASAANPLAGNVGWLNIDPRAGSGICDPDRGLAARQGPPGAQPRLARGAARPRWPLWTR
jgi:Na+(H+)/acetate symporter ActP